MNEQKLEGILAEARAAMEPTAADRDRIRKKVFAALGAAGIVTAVATSAAKTSVGAGGTITTGLSLVKLTVATVLIGGAVGLTRYFVTERTETSVNDVQMVKTFDSRQPVSPKKPSAVPLLTNPAPSWNEKDNVADEVEGASGEETAVRTAPVFEEPRVPKRKRKAVSFSNQHREAGSDSMLIKEISILKKASAALRDDCPDKAARILARYDREISKSVMSEERAGLGVLVLCSQGREKAARKAKQRFLKQSPNSPLAARIRKRCTRNEVTDD